MFTDKKEWQREYELSIDGESKRQKIHVLVARAFIPNPDNKPEVNHKIGMKFNCYVGNLIWATRRARTIITLKSKTKKTSFISATIPITFQSRTQAARFAKPNLKSREYPMKYAPKSKLIGQRAITPKPTSLANTTMTVRLFEILSTRANRR